MIIDILIFCVYALSSPAPSAGPAQHGHAVTQSQNSDGGRQPDKSGALKSVVWGT